MKRSPLLIAALGVLLLAGLALAATGEEPPPGWPNVLWALLGVVLPWIYQALFSKLPSWLRFIAAWGLTFAIVAVVDLVLLHWSIGQFLASIGIVISIMQAVYQLMTKPAAKARALRDSTVR